jgi:hypothetical protein
MMTEQEKRAYDRAWRRVMRPAVQPDWDFDVQLFAQAPSAELATVGIGRETTYGTAVSPTLFLIPSSENFDGTNELLDRPGARKRVGQTEAQTGLFTGKGQMQVEADGDSLGALLLLAMGAEAFIADPGNPGSNPAVTTSSSGQAYGPGWAWVTPAAMTNITVGNKLKVDTATPQENVVVRAVTATQFFAYFTNAHSGSVTIVQATTVTNAYDHTFTLASPRYSFTAQLNDVIMAKNAFGCKMSQLSFKLTPKAILEAMCQIEYQGEAFVGSPVSPTFSTLRGFTFTNPGNSFSMNGIALDSSVQDFSVDINVGLVTDYPKLGNGRYRGQLAETVTKVTGSFAIAFETETALQQFWGAPGVTNPQGQIMPAPLQIVLASTDPINSAVSTSLTINIPMAKFKTAPRAMKVGDYLKQTFQFQASESVNGAGDDANFVLVNSNASASF